MEQPMSTSQDRKKVLNEKRYNRKQQKDIQNHKYYRCGHEECLKSFHDYSSLYTHIQQNHQGMIHPNTKLKPPQKKELTALMQEHKGDKIEDPSFSIKIEDFIIYFLESENLLYTYLQFEQLIDRRSYSVSDFFHQESQEYFDILTLKSKKEYNNLFQEKYGRYLLIMQEYLKPFDTKTGNELGKVIQQIILNHEKDNDTIFEMIQKNLFNQNVFSHLTKLRNVQEGFVRPFIKEFKEVAEKMPQDHINQLQYLQDQEYYELVNISQDLPNTSQQFDFNQQQQQDQLNDKVNPEQQQQNRSRFQVVQRQISQYEHIINELRTLDPNNKTQLDQIQQLMYDKLQNLISHPQDSSTQNQLIYQQNLNRKNLMEMSQTLVNNKQFQAKKEDIQENEKLQQSQMYQSIIDGFEFPVGNFGSQSVQLQQQQSLQKKKVDLFQNNNQIIITNQDQMSSSVQLNEGNGTSEDQHQLKQLGQSQLIQNDDGFNDNNGNLRRIDSPAQSPQHNWI